MKDLAKRVATAAVVVTVSRVAAEFAVKALRDRGVLDSPRKV